MFSKLFTRNHPVETEKIEEPDETFLEWLYQMRNPTSTDTALRDAIKAHQTAAQPNTREAA